MEIPNFKLQIPINSQIPNSKFQKAAMKFQLISKFQTPNFKEQPLTLTPDLVIGDLNIGIYLEFGIWNLEFPPRRFP
jgi:hypothetical protein